MTEIYGHKNLLIARHKIVQCCTLFSV